MTPELAFYDGLPAVPPVIRALSSVPSAMDTLATLSSAQYIPTREMIDLVGLEAYPVAKSSSLPVACPLTGSAASGAFDDAPCEQFRNDMQALVRRSTKMKPLTAPS